jgi:hypothetical protein
VFVDPLPDIPRRRGSPNDSPALIGKNKQDRLESVRRVDELRFMEVIDDPLGADVRCRHSWDDNKPPGNRQVMPRNRPGTHSSSEVPTQTNHVR